MYLMRRDVLVVKEFVANKTGKISKLICSSDLTVPYQLVMSLIRNKDIKINGKRISKDIVISEGDCVTLYLKDLLNDYAKDIIYEDENILIVFKHRGIEVCDSLDSLLNNLLETTKKQLFAVHRLDRNTQGLIIFAKSLAIKEELEIAIRQHLIQKFYYALIFGEPINNEYNLHDYLKKDSKKSIVRISDHFEPGYVKIQTKFKVIKRFEGKSLVSVELITGKTHQIRAHLAFIGFPIVGDEKYGNHNLNKMQKLRYQCLCAYKLIFSFNSNSPLS